MGYLVLLFVIIIVWGLIKPFKIGSFQTKRWMFLCALVSSSVVFPVVLIVGAMGNAITNVPNPQINRSMATPEPTSKSDIIHILMDEQKIVDVMYRPNQAIQWHIGVIDDGTPRDGYALYVCEVLAENGLVHEDTRVRIIDMAKIMRGGVPGRSTSLGSMTCSTHKPFD